MSEKKEEPIISLQKDKIWRNNGKEIVGDYLIKDIIGEGTFSKVKLGINMFTGKKVAIKILDKLKLIEEEGIERVLREIKISSELNHPNIIKIYNIIEDEKNYLVIMEYCEEGELFNYIVKKDRLSENESSFFYYQLINAVEYLHSKGIAHRDLKPENILLGENHIIKLIDFGLSNYFDDKKLLITPCGSPCYASPEMIRGEDYNGADNDIWATGIILFAMLCGYLPFENDDENSENNNLLFKKILSGKLDYPDYLSNLSVDLMKKILVNSPKKRIKIDDIKKHKFYLKGKKIFEKKQESITINELKLIKYENIQNENKLTENNKGNIKDKYLKNLLTKNNKNKENNNKILNIFRNKYFDTKQQNKNNNLTYANNKLKNQNKNTQYLVTESNNIRLNGDNLVPLNTKLFDSLKKNENLKQTFNENNNNIYCDNILAEKISKNKEKSKNDENSTNLANLLPFNEKRYKLFNNLFTQVSRKKEKSMDYPHNKNKLYLNNNSINTEMNFKSPNKRPLIQVKIYSSSKKNKNKYLFEDNAFNTDINMSKPKIKMNDKLIINLTNNKEKNISLLRINKKLQSLEKRFNLNSSFKNMNERLKTDIKTYENFPYINSQRNGSIFSPKIEKIYNERKERRYFMNNLHNYINLKNKDYLNFFLNSKNTYHSPDSLKV